MSKKKPSPDDIDPATLPPWQTLTCSFAFEMKKDRANSLLSKILNNTKPFQKNIFRSELINFAKEKGFYADPNSLTEKQKKDPKLLEGISLELTPDVLGKAFFGYISELNLLGRKAKKDKIEGKDQPEKDKKGKESKKEGKKDPKKDKEPEEPKVEVPPEKEYAKSCDVVYFLADYPSNEEEFYWLSKNKGLVDLLMDFKEKFIEMEFEKEEEINIENNEEIQERMKEFEEDQHQEEDEEENYIEKAKKRKEMLPEDVEFVKENLKKIKGFNRNNF